MDDKLRKKNLTLNPLHPYPSSKIYTFSLSEEKPPLNDPSSNGVRLITLLRPKIRNSNLAINKSVSGTARQLSSDIFSREPLTASHLSNVVQKRVEARVGGSSTTT